MGRNQKNMVKERESISKFRQKLKKDPNNALSNNNILKPKGDTYNIAFELGKDLKRTQLRRVFHQLRKIQECIEKKKDYKEAIYETYPLLAYNKGRGNLPEDFYYLMVDLLSLSEKDEKFAEKTVKFVEALVAYHKFHYSKET